MSDVSHLVEYDSLPLPRVFFSLRPSTVQASELSKILWGRNSGKPSGLRILAHNTHSTAWNTFFYRNTYCSKMLNHREKKIKKLYFQSVLSLQSKLNSSSVSLPPPCGCVWTVGSKVVVGHNGELIFCTRIMCPFFVAVISFGSKKKTKKCFVPEQLRAAFRKVL